MEFAFECKVSRLVESTQIMSDGVALNIISDPLVLQDPVGLTSSLSPGPVCMTTSLTQDLRVCSLFCGGPPSLAPTMAASTPSSHVNLNAFLPCRKEACFIFLYHN